MTDSINLQIPINTLGYGVFSMALYRALVATPMFHQISIIPIGNGTVDNVYGLRGMLDILESWLVRDLARPPDFDAPTVTVWHPGHMDISFKSRVNIGYVLFETDAFMPEELQSMRDHCDIVATASKWGVDVLKAHGLPAALIPGPNPLQTHKLPIEAQYIASLCIRDIQPALWRDLAMANKLVIASSGKWEIRKGHHQILQSLDELENCCLLAMWDNPFTGGLQQPMGAIVRAGWHLRDVANSDEVSVYHYEKETNDILLMSRMSSYANTLQVYREADILISASAGEGLDLPVVEAISLGIPVIATRNTAHTDYVDPFLGLDTALAVARDGIWFHGNRGNWYPTTVDQIVNAIKWVQANRNMMQGIATEQCHTMQQALNHTKTYRALQQAIKAAEQ